MTDAEKNPDDLARCPVCGAALIDPDPARCFFVEDLRRFAEPPRPVNLDRKDGPMREEFAE